MEKVAILARDGKVQEMLEFLNHGFEFKPELGDHDHPYLRVFGNPQA